MRLIDAITESSIPRLEAEMLAGFLLSKPRSWIIAHSDEEISTKNAETFYRLCKRRSEGEPMAYIIGKKEFYGRDFIVTPATLIPRPATEGLIDLTKEFLRQKRNETREIDTGIVAISRVLSHGVPRIILDIGTGSGCIAITLALEGVKQKIIGVDISAEAIIVAEKNAKEHQVMNLVTFLHANGIDIIASMNEPFLIVSNPPYIPEKTTLEKTVRDYEPHTALFAGGEGLNVIRSILTCVKKNKYCTGIIIECCEDHIDQFEMH